MINVPSISALVKNQSRRFRQALQDIHASYELLETFGRTLLARNSSVHCSGNLLGPDSVFIHIAHVPVDMVIDLVCPAFRSRYGVDWRMDVDPDCFMLRTTVHGRIRLCICVHEEEMNSCRIIRVQEPVKPVFTERVHYVVQCPEEAA